MAKPRQQTVMHPHYHHLPPLSFWGSKTIENEISPLASLKHYHLQQRYDKVSKPEVKRSPAQRRNIIILPGRKGA